MNQEHFFKSAKWVGARERTEKTFAVLRGYFSVREIKKVTLNILGMGFFKCYINGKCINPDTFLPLSSEYENNNGPEGEIFSGHRVYVPSFDITPYVKTGENVIAVHFGGGWYVNSHRPIGLPKAIYSVTVEESEKENYFVSDERCKICKSFVCDYTFVSTERHDFDGFSDCLAEDFDDSECENAVVTERLETEYLTTDCPCDVLGESLSVRNVGKGEVGTVYDCGRNTSGYPVLKLNAGKGESVNVYFSENLLPDGSLDKKRAHGQKFSVVSDGTGRVDAPEFTWYGFRYLEIEGNADVLCVKEIHADVPVTSSFECDNETLNWIYSTFIHTMLCNMHIGHPSDCPHIERRGYTGDGQLTSHAVLSIFDARAFYEKWLCDIADGQDVLSGHVQYTAPYVESGGGPGGWGAAIVEVPYQLYRHYGDEKILVKYYENMRRYIDYLDAHSEFGLVTSDREGAWCLGDWCGPNILYPEKQILFHRQQVFLPAPYVNTYFKVKSLKQMCEIAHIIGRDEDVAEYEAKLSEGKNAMRAAYFNTFDGNFVMNVQGANAFAVDIGIDCGKNNGESLNPYENMVGYYKKLGHLDTGIFATDILIRTLFENGDGELAVELLTSDGPQGFEHWRKNGATTFHEYWDSEISRSHNHPMFGAVTAYIFEHLLGIGQKNGTAGYSSVVISPKACAKFKKMSGSMKTPNGIISVSYEKHGECIDFCIYIPENTDAVFLGFDREIKLSDGENKFSIR